MQPPVPPPPGPGPGPTPPSLPRPEEVLPAPPPDNAEDKERIDKLVSYVTKNGLPFQHKVKEKEKDNVQFSFLFDGEHSLYYRWRLHCALKQYTDEEVRNILQQHASRLESVPPGTLDLIAADKLLLQKLLVENSGSKEAIRALRKFVIDRAHSSTAVGKELKLFAQHLVSPQSLSSSSDSGSQRSAQFTKVLHLIYAVNDVLFNRTTASLKGPYTAFIADLKPDWSPSKLDLVAVLLPQIYQIFRIAYSHSDISTEKEKLKKLIELWTSKKLISDAQASQCVALMTSSSSYEPPVEPFLCPPHILNLPHSSNMPSFQQQRPPGLSQQSHVFSPPPTQFHPPPPAMQPPHTFNAPQFQPPLPVGFPQPSMLSTSQPFHPLGMSAPPPPAPVVDLHMIPVGIMSDIVRNVLKLGHEPYKPLSASELSQPSVTPTIEPGRLEARVLDFYRKVEKSFNDINNDNFERKRKRSRGNSFADEVDYHRSNTYNT